MVSVDSVTVLNRLSSPEKSVVDTVKNILSTKVSVDEKIEETDPLRIVDDCVSATRLVETTVENTVSWPLSIVCVLVAVCWISSIVDTIGVTYPSRLVQNSCRELCEMMLLASTT